MAREGTKDPRTQLLELLLDKVRRDPYPSTTMMDMIESLLDEEHTSVYAEVLLSKMRDEDFPSIDHLRRVAALG